jgi:transcriptional regulator of arginine metabolism
MRLAMHLRGQKKPMPTDAEIRQNRQREILALLESFPVGSQGEIVTLLEERGIHATQSSVSRDLRDLGVARLGGRYVAPGTNGAAGPAGTLQEGANLGFRFGDIERFLRGAKPAGPYLTVVFTTVGTAQTVALALDHAGWPEVVGTMAGDDTIFVATANAGDQPRFLERIERSLHGR